VPHTAVIPDGHIILAPLEPHLGVMVLGHKIEQVAEKHVGLVLGDAVDAFGETLIDVHGLPPRHSCQESVDRTTYVRHAKTRPLTICSNYRMNGLKALACIQRGASGILSDRVAKTSRLLVEKARIVRGCQALKKSLHAGGQAVVYFIARCPELLTFSENSKRRFLHKRPVLALSPGYWASG
jgi:hypothetical protein